MFHRHLKLHLMFPITPKPSLYCLIHAKFCQSSLTPFSPWLFTFTHQILPILNPKYFLSLSPFLLLFFHFRPSSSLIRTALAVFWLIQLTAVHFLNGARVIFHEFKLDCAIFLYRAFWWIYLAYKIGFKLLDIRNQTFHNAACPYLSCFTSHFSINTKLYLLIYLLILFSSK